MTIGYQEFRLAKRGCDPEEYEDACLGDLKAGRFAVADGATESVFASSWAARLVREFVENADCDPEEWVTWVPGIQQRWAAEFVGRELPWHAEAKMQQGAFATFLGLALMNTRRPPYPWQAVAVGDSCLFHTRGDELVRAFPIENSQEFGTSPWLVGSRTSQQQIRQDRVAWGEGVCQADDRLWLMTDALAQWFLSEHEAGRRPWQETERFSQPPPRETEREGLQQDFADWIEQLRDAKRLRNDDVTLLVVTM